MKIRMHAIGRCLYRLLFLLLITVDDWHLLLYQELPYNNLVLIKHGILYLSKQIDKDLRPLLVGRHMLWLIYHPPMRAKQVMIMKR